jgi:DNA-binding MarR family transcriptional regulator
MRRVKAGASPEGESIAFLMRDTYGAFARSFQEELARAGMTMSMWFFMRALAKEEGLSQTQLMERAGLLQPATSAALKQMAGMGLIVRRDDPSDRRMARFFLTAKSRSLLKKLLPAAARVRERAVVDFTVEELDQLRGLLRRMKTNLENGGGKA